MPASTPAKENKHLNNSAATRDALIRCAQQLYAQRSIDDVSLNEITAAAGQKNRNALQYHFGNREGLLQAIIDRHANEVYERRHTMLQQQEEHTTATVAQALVKPLTDYIADNPEAEDYVMIVPQLGVVNMPNIHAVRVPGIKLKQDALFITALNTALASLPRREAQQRVFLATSFLFNSLADFYRALRSDRNFARSNPPSTMATQLQYAIEAILSRPTSALGTSE